MIKIDRNKLAKWVIGTTLAPLILAACSVAPEKKESGETSTTTNQVALSKMEEIKASMSSQSEIEWEETLFEMGQPLEQRQDRYRIKLKDLSWSYARSSHQDLEIISNKNGKQGSILLMELEITNLSSQDFYFPVESFELTESSAVAKYIPKSQLIPSDQVDLLGQLQDQNRLIKAGESLSGYVAYVIDGEESQAMMDKGVAYLSVLSPSTDPNAIIGLTDTSKEVSLPFFLALNSEMETVLIENTVRIQDRLSAELWGEKRLLAQIQDLVQESQDGISMKVKRVELTDLDLYEDYEESFQYFPNGQIILTLELEIDNQSDYDLLPVDSPLSAIINQDMIQSDYALITQVYGEKIPAKSKGTLIKAFALDRGTYEARWQDEEIQFSYALMVENQDGPADEADSGGQATPSDEGENESETSEVRSQEGATNGLPFFQFNFTWKPNLQAWITSDYQVVPIENKNRTESETSSLFDESQEESDLETSGVSEGE